jgi:hypothetical protein
LEFQVPRAILEKKIERATTRQAKLEAIAELDTLLAKRQVLIGVTRDIVSHVTKDAVATETILASQHKLTNFDCYFPAVKAYNAQCFDLACNDYSLRQMYALVNLCETGYKNADIIASIDTLCSSRTKECGIY